MSTMRGDVMVVLALCAGVGPAWAERGEREAKQAATAAERGAFTKTVGRSEAHTYLDLTGSKSKTVVRSPNLLSSAPGTRGSGVVFRRYDAPRGGELRRVGTDVYYRNGAKNHVDADGTMVHETKQGQTTSTQRRDEKGRFLPGE
jgi:hypothetical protein